MAALPRSGGAPGEPQKTVFLDRDGVLNHRIPGDYVTHPGELQPLDRVFEAVRLLSEKGFRLVVVTNQRGIALGRMTRRAVDEIHRWLDRRAEESGGCLREFYVCPHDRDEGCNCRKPKPGLLDQAHRHRPVDWTHSFLIGDSDSDILAGKSRGVTTIKIGDPSPAGADHCAADLLSAAHWVVEQAV